LEFWLKTSEFGNRYRKPRIAVICHQFERKEIAPMPNFATKEKLRLAQKLLLPQNKKKTPWPPALYI
jgi:hypothetical protein